MIILTPEVASGLGEDTFWTWMKREFPDSVFNKNPSAAAKGDVILRYSTMGASNFYDNSVALLWELHPEMKVALKTSQYDQIINKIHACAQSCKYKTTPTELTRSYYPEYESVDVMPIGVNTDMFAPVTDKAALRAKWGIPSNRRVIFWGGTTHPMKGFNHLLSWRAANPDAFFIVVWKTPGEAGSLPDAKNFTHIPQQQIAELMNCADAFLSCGTLRPFFMIEWEAMACNLPIINMHSLEKDFVPSQNPRDDVFRLGWDRHSAKKKWREYLDNIASKAV
jgi:hypothetical protein